MEEIKCMINTRKLEELLECEINDISQEYNALYVRKGKGRELIDYLELFGVVGKLHEDTFDDIVDIVNGEIVSESFGNALLGDGSIKPSFTIRIDVMKRII